MNNMPTAMKDSCGPCLTDKQIKKKNEEDAKELKAIINYLCKFNGYDNAITPVIGGLVTRLFRLQGPLK